VVLPLLQVEGVFLVYFHHDHHHHSSGGGGGDCGGHKPKKTPLTSYSGTCYHYSSINNKKNRDVVVGVTVDDYNACTTRFPTH
jgi:hypothetical protein